MGQAAFSAHAHRQPVGHLGARARASLHQPRVQVGADPSRCEPSLPGGPLARGQHVHSQAGLFSGLRPRSQQSPGPGLLRQSLAGAAEEGGGGRGEGVLWRLRDGLPPCLSWGKSPDPGVWLHTPYLGFICTPGSPVRMGTVHLLESVSSSVKWAPTFPRRL